MMADKLITSLAASAVVASGLSSCSNTSGAGPSASASSTATLAPGDLSNGADNFYKSDKVTVQKVTFKNQYKMNVVGNLFVPKSLKAGSKASAIVVGHPMGAVKEQSANLYATKLAEQGFVTLSFDQSFWGESDGQPRNAVAPDVYAENFSAAVDFLGTQSSVDRERIGVLGICASGAFVISEARIDPRIKAVATVSMVDMGSVVRGLDPAHALDERRQQLVASAQQRDVEFTGGKPTFTGGTPEHVDDKSSPLDREFYGFYRTARGYSPNTTTQPTLSSYAKFANFYPFVDIETISPRPMLFVVGDHAISRGFSEQAYKLAGEPKELFVVPGAGHVDLYDRVNLIPFDKLTSFFKTKLQ